MGLDAELVIEKHNNDILCPICHKIVYPPLELSCTHLVCEKCFSKCKSRCPICNKSDKKPKTQSNAIRTIGKLKCKCIHFNQGCKWVGSISDCKKHMKRCDFEIVQCSFNECKQKMKRSMLDDHLINCVWRPSECVFCKKKMVFKELKVFLSLIWFNMVESFK